MSIYSCKSGSKFSLRCRATMLLAMVIFAFSVHANGAAQIEDHYFGATLLVVQTGNTVLPPVGVKSLTDYESTYGRTLGPAVDHGYQAARIFFANGGQTLYVIDPQGTTVQNFSDALAASVGLPVDLVAIPGAACCSASLIKHVAIMSALSQHVNASPNRFGLIDAPLDSDPNALLAYRANFSSEHAALYAPWLVLNDPEHGTNVTVSSSSAVAGVITRIDQERGIWKTPAGPGAKLYNPPNTDLEREFSLAEHESLNAANVNMLRKFVSPPTINIWGGRTTSDVDSERRYVPVARFLRHLEFSMNRSLPGIVGIWPTDSNPGAVKANVKLLIEHYLSDYYHQGAFQGARPEDAYFVDCTTEPSTCVVGVSMMKPAEFSLFRVPIPLPGDVIFASGFEANESVQTEA